MKITKLLCIPFNKWERETNVSKYQIALEHFQCKILFFILKWNNFTMKYNFI